jgi:DNA-binding CsgD family transcriptional regulator
MLRLKRLGFMISYARYSLVLAMLGWPSLSSGQDYPPLANLLEREAVLKADSFLTHSGSYPAEDQGALYDSLEFLVNYFRLDTLRIKTYLRRGRYALSYHHDVKKALQYFNNAKELAIEAGDTRSELNALVQIAQLYNKTRITEKTTEAILSLKKRAEEVGDSTNLSAAYFLLGQADVNVTDYSVQMFRKSLNYYNHTGSNRVSIYANLGQAYMAKEDPNLDSARYFLEKASSLSDSLQLDGYVKNTLAEVYLQQGRDQRAEQILRQLVAERDSVEGAGVPLLTYRLLIELLQSRQQYEATLPYIREAIASTSTAYYDDYDLVDFSRAAKASLAVLGKFDTYQTVDSLERMAADSIQAYVEAASVSQSAYTYAVSQMETNLDRKDTLLQNKNIIIGVLALVLALGATVGYLSYSRRRLGVQKQLSENEMFRMEGEMAQRVQQQERQLSSYAMSLAQKNRIASQVLEQLKGLNRKAAANGEQKSIESSIKLLENDLRNEDQWKNFLVHFERVHPDFYRKLNERYPNLTKQDHRLMAYLRMQLSTKEIAQLLGVNYESVNTTRYRIRKKLNLPKEVDLSTFVTQL